MTIFGGILLFTTGCILGGSAVAYNHYSVKQATAKLVKENERLKDSIWDVRLKTEVKKAYKDGYRSGNVQV